MNKHLAFISLLLFTGVVIASCKHEPDPIVPVDKRLDLIPCNADSIYFYNDVVPIFVNNCAFSGCHSPISLSDYDDIINIGDVTLGDTNNSYIYSLITSTDINTRMPPAPKDALPRAQIDKIGKWIMQGANPNACNDCDETKFSFNANVLPIIVKNCQGCHGDKDPTGGISLTNYFKIKIQVNNGKLMGSLNHANGFVSMPPSGKMPDCQINVIQNWINNGANND